MRFERLKGIAKSSGVYRPIRWMNLHLFRRHELAKHQLNLRFFAPMLRPNELVFDVGANWGQSSEIFLDLDARVVAFEPVPDCRAELEARIGKNWRFEVVASAVGARVDEATIHVNSHRGASSLLSDWSPDDNIQQKIIVPVTTLDLMIQEYGKPRYIKIDVEGYESEVLSGLSTPVALVSFEYTRDFARGTEGVRSCVEHLSSLDDILINITPAEDFTFTYREWIQKDEFLSRYPKDYMDDFKYRYGDIFVRSLGAERDAARLA